MSTAENREQQGLQRAIHRSKVERARRMTGVERMVEGIRLFEQVRDRMEAGIQARHGEWTAEQVQQEFLAQMAKQRAYEEKGIYTVFGYLNDDCTISPTPPVGE